MRISERGQVTISRIIREQFGLLPNTGVEFQAKKGGEQLAPNPSAKRRKIDQIYGGHQLAQSTDELMKLLRK